MAPGRAGHHGPAAPLERHRLRKAGKAEQDLHEGYHRARPEARRFASLAPAMRARIASLPPAVIVSAVHTSTPTSPEAA